MYDRDCVNISLRVLEYLLGDRYCYDQFLLKSKLRSQVTESGSAGDFI